MKTSFQFIFALGIAIVFVSPVDSCAATHLSKVDEYTVGDNQALQGIAAGPENFYTSKGGFWFTGEWIYEYNSNWNFLRQEDADPGLANIAHCGDITTDGSHIYAPLSNFGGTGSSRFGIAAYDRSTMSYQGFADLTSDINPDGDLAGVARYHNSIYAVEWLDNDSSANARILRYDFIGSDTIYLAATYQIDNRYANGIAFYGNYVYISHGDGSLLNSADYGNINVFRVDDLSTSGVNTSIRQYTYDCETYHAEGLTFNGTELWVSNGDKVTKLQTPSVLAEYVTWVGAGSDSAGSETNWSGYYGWDGTPTSSVDAKVNFASAGTLVVNSVANTKNLYIDGPGAVRLESGGQLSSNLGQFVGYDGGTGTFTQTGGTNSVRGTNVGGCGLYLGCDSGSIGTYELSNGQLSSNLGQFVGYGYGGTGTFTQTGGTNSVGSKLFLGYNSGSNGTYNLSGSGQLSSNDDQYIGNSGTGMFRQTGGTNSVGYHLHLGERSGSSGTYELSNGQLSSRYNQYVGWFGTGTFTQTGGTNNVGKSLYLAASYSGSNGTYNLSNNGQLSSTDDQYIGNSGTGTFTQTGGTNSVGSNLFLGYNSGSNGLYELGGNGQLSSANNQYVGRSGTGVFKQSGGTNLVGNTLFLGYNSGSNGMYELGGNGQISTDVTTVGKYGEGLFKQTGATYSAGEYLYIGFDSGSVGTYELVNGQLFTQYVQRVGNQGTGTFRQTGGTNSVVNGLLIGCYSGSNGTYELSEGQMTTRSAEVGCSGTGTFRQTGGTSSISMIYLGDLSGSIGIYELSGNGHLNSDCQYIGNNGTGTFKQTGGTNMVGISNDGRALEIGRNSSSYGTYELSGNGQLFSSDHQNIGTYGTGMFKQTGGTNSVGSYLYIGRVNGASGTYELSGSGNLSSNCSQYIGYNGTGIFDQTGGTNLVGSDLLACLYVGYLSSSNGSYELSNGDLSSGGHQFIGYHGTGTFKQSSGSNIVHLTLEVGSGSGSNGMYELVGGQLSSGGGQEIGHDGIGMFKQLGGANFVGTTLSIGSNDSSNGGNGTYEMLGGSLSASTIAVGLTGIGRLNIGSTATNILVSDQLIFGPNSEFNCVAGAKIHMTGSVFGNASTDPTALSGLSNLTMIFEGGTEDLDPFEFAGEDLGAVMAGFQNNFALGTLQLGGELGIGRLQLADAFDNQPDWSGSEALYVTNLILGEGSYLDLNGLNLYYQTFTNLGGTIDFNGGALSAVPEPNSALLFLVGLAVFLAYDRRKRN